MNKETKPPAVTLHISAAFLVAVLSSVLLFSAVRSLLHPDYPDLIIGVMVQAPVFAVIYLAGRRFYRLKEIRLKVELKSLLMGVSGWLLVVFIWGLYTIALIKSGVELPIPQVELAQFAKKSVNNLYLALFTVCFLAPVSEELLFRGFFFGALRKRYPMLISAAISSAIFGILHGSIVFFPMLIFGFYQCYLTEKNKSLDVPIIIHIINNTFSILTAMFGL